MTDLIKKARKKSKKNPCKYKVAAICYDKRNNLLGIAYNVPRFEHKGGGTHAEMMALQKWGVTIKRMTLIRFGNGGDLLPIEPCKSCKRVLDKLGVKVTHHKGDK